MQAVRPTYIIRLSLLNPRMQVHTSEADGAADDAVASRPAKCCRLSFDSQHGELAVPTVKATRSACPAEPC